MRSKQLNSGYMRFGTLLCRAIARKKLWLRQYPSLNYFPRHRVFMMTIKNKNKRDDWGKYHGLSGQVAVKYRRNVSSLSIDMSADNRTTTLGRHIDQHIGRVSVDISTDTSVDMSTNISRLTYRPTLDWYVDRHIGRHSADIDRYISRQSANMSTDTSVDTWLICRPIYRSRGAQNTHDPRKLLHIQYVTTAQSFN